jgi:hypothetical protein
MDNNSPLKYNDEQDRSLGLAGMAISMVVWEGEDKLAAISIDNPMGKGIELAPEVRFAGNPHFSPRSIWQQQVKHLELAAAMIMGNAMCRAYVLKGKPISSKVNASLKALVRDEARSVCSLEDDEIEAIFAKTYNYVERMFTNDGIAELARRFASELCDKRTMSAAEVIERLRALNRII